ncbi:MAG: hypothetical protein M1833_003575 [Piccolia ochrophora]|nr:MAG: hypothetical protein M1833_003575 [Piccolia ochrophora]
MKALVTGQRSMLNRAYNGITGSGIGHGASVAQVPVPEITANELLVKVHTVALNPTDFKHIDLVSPAHSIIGCDYAGEVAEVGSNATDHWKVGDRIAGVAHGGLFPDKGTFAEYCKVEADLAWKVPDRIADHEAATYGVSACTAMQGLYHTLGLPWPDTPESPTTATPPPEILIYAASTAAGLFCVQMAKNAGYRVISTCSPHSFDLVKSYGADETFDYRSPSAIEDIKKSAPNISDAFDGISEGPSTDFCAKTLRDGGSVVTLLNRGKSKTPGVEYKLILAYTLLGHPFAWFPPFGPKFPAKPSDREALARFYKLLPSLTTNMKAPPLKVVPGGFEGLTDALDLLREKKVSGKKVVVDIV